MKNKIISIGYLGGQICYLNVTEEDVIKRYCETNEHTREEFEEFGYDIRTIELEDEFNVYDIWEKGEYC